MQIVVDLDGTLCTEERQFSRALARPLPGACEALSRLHAAGHTILIYSARTWAEFEMTTHWLREHGFQYHQLILGKPIGEVWIDDRALRFTGWDKALTDLESRRTTPPLL